MIVIAIIVCVSVVSLPTMFHVIADVRTRSTMASLSSIVQECRSYAIKTNKIMTVHFTIQNGQSVAYIQDAAAPASLANAEQRKVAFLGMGVTKATTPGPPAMTALQMWQSSTATINTNEISFNSRGLPCYYDATTTPPSCDPSLNYGFIYYFTYQPPYGANGWTGLSVSPAGRIKSWMWNGAKWSN